MAARTGAACLHGHHIRKKRHNPNPTVPTFARAIGGANQQKRQRETDDNADDNAANDKAGVPARGDGAHELDAEDKKDNGLGQVGGYLHRGLIGVSGGDGARTARRRSSFPHLEQGFEANARVSLHGVEQVVLHHHARCQRRDDAAKLEYLSREEANVAERHDQRRADQRKVADSAAKKAAEDAKDNTQENAACGGRKRVGGGGDGEENERKREEPPLRETSLCSVEVTRCVDPYRRKRQKTR